MILNLSENSNTNDDDFIVCDYFYQTKDGLTLLLGQYEEDNTCISR